MKLSCGFSNVMYLEKSEYRSGKEWRSAELNPHNRAA